MYDMTEIPKTTEDIGAEMRSNYAKFKQYNNDRLKLATPLFGEKKRDLLQLIPVIVHININNIPGSVKDERDAIGIEGLEYSERDNALLLKYFKDVRYKKPLSNNPGKNRIVKSVFLVGAEGTVAQTLGGDMNLWLFVQDSSKKKILTRNLRTKLAAIEEWAMRHMKVRVNFFIADVNRARDNSTSLISPNSRHTNENRILKEEFYRTGILIAGKPPFWWSAPVNVSEREYYEYWQLSKDRCKDSADQFIDLGYLTELDKYELRSNALVQIVKGFKNPYKSAVKIAYLELLASEKAENRLLANQMKDRIFRSKSMPNLAADISLDSHAIMFDYIRTNYLARGMTSEVSLVQTCLYIQNTFDSKSGASIEMPSDISARQEYITTWELSAKALAGLDSFEAWNFAKAFRICLALQKFMISRYSNLAKKTRSHNEAYISPDDLTVIGGKIDSFFSKKPNKLMPLPKRLSVKRHFPQLVVERKNELTFPFWLLRAAEEGEEFRENVGTVDAGESENVLLTDTNIVTLLAKAVMAELITKDTSVKMIPNRTYVKQQDVENIVFGLTEEISGIAVADMPRQRFTEKGFAEVFLIILNTMTPRDDTKIKTYDVIYRTSRGEVFVVNTEPKSALNFFRLRDHIAKRTNKTKFSVLTMVDAEGGRLNKEIIQLLGLPKQGVESLHQFAGLNM